MGRAACAARAWLAGACAVAGHLGSGLRAPISAQVLMSPRGQSALIFSPSPGGAPLDITNAHIHLETWPLIGQTERKRLAVERLKICDQESKERDLLGMEDRRDTSPSVVVACCHDPEVLEWDPSSGILRRVFKRW